MLLTLFLRCQLSIVVVYTLDIFVVKRIVFRPQPSCLPRPRSSGLYSCHAARPSLLVRRWVGRPIYFSGEAHYFFIGPLFSVKKTMGLPTEWPPHGYMYNVGLNVRGESLTLRSCCSRILLLFCCYCSTLQHCSVPNVNPTSYINRRF